MIDYIAERHRASPLDSLSHGKRQILQIIAEGKTSAQRLASCRLDAMAPQGAGYPAPAAA